MATNAEAFAGLIEAGPIDGYQNGGRRKAAFKNKGLRFLQDVAKAMGLETKDRDIRFNKAGPAVSGDLVLHTDRVALYITCSFTGLAPAYCRAVKSREDHFGSHNVTVPMARLYDVGETAMFLLQVQRKD